jgi:hypothetical protein
MARAMAFAKTDLPVFGGGGEDDEAVFRDDAGDEPGALAGEIEVGVMAQHIG